MKTSMTAIMAVVLCVSGTAWAKDHSPGVPKGAQVGLVNLLSGEIMHYHAATDPQDSFVKVVPVDWPIADMLAETVKGPLEQLGLVPTALPAGEKLTRVREKCFVDSAPVKELGGACGTALEETAAAGGVSYLIVLAPGLNNYDHAGRARNDSVPETLRGWGLRSRDTGAKDKPTAMNEVELVFLDVHAGKATVRARQWGGVYSARLDNYTLPSDPRQLGDEDLEKLRSTYLAMLARQAQVMLEQVTVVP